MRRVRAQELLDLAMATNFPGEAWTKRMGKEATAGLGSEIAGKTRPLGRTRKDVAEKLRLLGVKPTPERIAKYLARQPGKRP